MKKINIREALLEIDRKTSCQYDLTSLYEACKLDDKDKHQLVKYIASYDHPSIIGDFLSTRCDGLSESVEDDITEDDMKKVIDDVNEGEDHTLWALMDKADKLDESFAEDELEEDTGWRTNPSNRKEVQSYVYRKIRPYDEFTSDDSPYWSFDTDVDNRMEAMLLKSIDELPQGESDVPVHSFSLKNDTVDIDFYYDWNNETWYVIDHKPDLEESAIGDKVGSKLLGEDTDDDDPEYVSDFSDGEVESGMTFFEDGYDWKWVRRVGDVQHLDFDNWAVWMAFRPEDESNPSGRNVVNFFVVDEDTGFIDWGPVDTAEEALEFLQSKVDDWENDVYTSDAEDVYESKPISEPVDDAKSIKESSTDSDYLHCQASIKDNVSDYLTGNELSEISNYIGSDGTIINCKSGRCDIKFSDEFIVHQIPVEYLDIEMGESIKESFPRNINLDQVVIQVANLVDDRVLGDDWIEVFPTRDSRPTTGGEYYIPLEITGPGDVTKKATFKTRNGRVEVAFLNGSEAMCDSAESIATFIAGEFGLALPGETSLLSEDAVPYDKDAEFNDKYFPRVNTKDTSRYDYVQHKGKDFAYDKKNNVLIYLFKDAEEIEKWGEDKAPWRELDSVGLRAENWNDAEMRTEYLDEYCSDFDEESSYLVQDFIQNELPYYKEQGLVENSEEKPYTYKQIFDDLKEKTNNFTISEGQLKCGYLSEAEDAVKILEKHYASVEMDKVGSWFQVEFKDLKEKDKKEQLEEGVQDFRFEVSCNDGPTKVISTVAENEESAINYVKNYYAQEHTTYADDRANKWAIKNLYNGREYNESLQEEWNREWDNIGIEIEKAARAQHIGVDFINTDSSVMGAFKATFEINRGDWKHDHWAFDEVVKEYLANNEKYGLWKIDTNQIGSSLDDSYSAEHIAFIVPRDKMELLNSMKGLFAESVNPADLTDCPECGDTSFDSKRGRCTKCSYREALEESSDKGYNIKFYQIFQSPKKPTENGKMVAQCGTEDEAHEKGKKLCGEGNYLIKAVCDDGKTRYLEQLNESKSIKESIDIPLSKIIEVFRGDEEYFEEAARIIRDWYVAEGCDEDFDDVDDFIDWMCDDIFDMVDAATDPREVRIVKKAIGEEEWDY